MLAIPGVGWVPGYVLAAWDVAWRVGELLGIEVPETPDKTGGVEAPGMTRYEELGLRELLRGYQKQAVLFLLYRAYGICGLPMRTGKCLVALAAAIALGARQVLIVAPAQVKWVWAAEIAKWCKTPAIILEGRSGQEAQRYCMTCKGKGLAPDGSWCEDCRQLNGQSYGYQILEVRTVSKPVRAPHIPLPTPRCLRRRARVIHHAETRLNLMPRERPYGPPYPRADQIELMRQAVEALRELGGEYQCSKHPEVRSTDSTVLCMRCRQELLAELRAAPYVISNYDILVAQEHHTGAGEIVGERLDLPGWAPMIPWISFDLAVLDEIQLLRGRPEKKRRGKSRKDRSAAALVNIPRVWGLTGTLIFNFTRDQYGPIDVCSDGLFGQPFYDFDRRYCQGHTNIHGGWNADGRSLLAETELKRRMDILMLKRERKEILPELPAKQRQVVHVDAKSVLPPFARAEADRRAAIGRSLALTLDHKLDVIATTVVAEMLEGNCVVVFTYIRKNAERVFRAIEEEAKKPQNRLRLRGLNAQTWLAHGEVSSKARYDLSVRFCEHAASGAAGAFVSTIDAMQTGISLKGASSVHFAELHYSPAAMLQAEDRPYEVGITGLSIVYYVLRGSIDEHIIDVLMPKFETQTLLEETEGADDARRALGGAEEECAEDIWRRLTQHLRSENE